MLSRLSYKIAVTIALVAASLVPAGTAHADTLLPTQAVVAGTGFVVPGLPCTNCTVGYGFTAVTAGGIGAVFTGCMLTGNTQGLANELTEAGSGVIDGCGITGSVSYTRVAAVEVWTGTLFVFGICHVIEVGVLAWVPTSVLPVTTYALAGTLTLAPC
jgi:hypothetical protein